jgi:hypothetical protein
VSEAPPLAGSEKIPRGGKGKSKLASTAASSQPASTAAAAAEPSSSSPAAAAAASQASAPPSIFKKAAAAGEVAKKARGEKPARGGISEENLSEVVSSLAELTLVNSRDIAMLRSILISVCNYNQEDETKFLYKLYKDTTKAYDAALLAMSPEEKADSSSVHIFVWLALLECEQLSTATVVVTHKEAVKTEVNHVIAEMKKERGPELEGGTQEPINEEKILRSILERQVKMFRANTCWTPKLMRLEGQATETALPVLQFIIALLVSKGKGTVRHNQQPRGKQERKLQKFLGQR